MSNMADKVDQTRLQKIVLKVWVFRFQKTAALRVPSIQGGCHELSPFSTLDAHQQVSFTAFGYSIHRGVDQEYEIKKTRWWLLCWDLEGRTSFIIFCIRTIESGFLFIYRYGTRRLRSCCSTAYDLSQITDTACIITEVGEKKTFAEWRARL